MAPTKFNPNQLPTSAPQSVTVTLTANEIKALKATPIEIIPAPGSGFAVMPITITLSYIAGATPYSGTGEHFIFLLGTNPIGGSGMSDSMLAEATNQFLAQVVAFGISGATVDCANKSISISIDEASELTLGNGTLVVNMQYNIVPVA